MVFRGCGQGSLKQLLGVLTNQRIAGQETFKNTLSLPKWTMFPGGCG